MALKELLLRFCLIRLQEQISRAIVTNTFLFTSTSNWLDHSSLDLTNIGSSLGHPIVMFCKLVAWRPSITENFLGQELLHALIKKKEVNTAWPADNMNRVMRKIIYLVGTTWGDHRLEMVNVRVTQGK